jgi:hypothetical protein
MNLLCCKTLLFTFLIASTYAPAVWAESLFLESAKTRQDPAKGDFDPIVAIKGLTQNPEGTWTAAEAKSKTALQKIRDRLLLFPVKKYSRP